jgi:predicted permease
VQALPGVESAAFGSRVPLGFGGNNSTTVSIDGYTPRADEEVVITYTTVSAGYFRTMGIPIRAGREYADTDTPTSPRTLVINETMARRYWPDGNAVGKIVRFGPNAHEVVGIVADAKHSSINELPRAQLFIPMARSEVSTLRLFVRADGDPAAHATTQSPRRGDPGPLVADIRNAIRGLDPNLPVYDARTLNEHMQGAIFAQRMAADLLGAMGVLALLLAAIGLYGVMAYAVSQRTQEMGIRLALGASPASLLNMVVGQGMKLTSVGLVIGLAIALGAFGSIGAVRTLLPGISPLDPMTFIAVPALLAAIAFVATWIPAKRAGRVDPVVALRVD